MAERSNRTFTTISRNEIGDIISSAVRHLIYAAPGITSDLAKAIVDLSPEVSVRVILDADGEAIRLGFGDENGLRLLSEKGVDVRSAPGLRIGILSVDDRAWVYAPTPEIILDQPQVDESNAVEVDATFAKQILFALAPDISLVPDERILDEQFTNSESEAEIGRDPVVPADIEDLKRDLKGNPPQKYDAARRVRVYQGYLQFVELNFQGAHIAAHKIQIPNDFLNVNDAELSQRIKSTCNLIQDKGRFSTRIELLEIKVKNLRKQYVRPLGKRYGSVLLRREKGSFDKSFKELAVDLKTLQKSIRDDLQKEILSSRSKLTELVISGWERNPPAQFQANDGTLDKAFATEYVENTLDRQSPAAAELVGRMQLTCDYKDVTIEMMNDGEFMNAVRDRFPDENFEKLYSEQKTIAEKQASDSEQDTLF